MNVAIITLNIAEYLSKAATTVGILLWCILIEVLTSLEYLVMYKSDELIWMFFYTKLNYTLFLV